MMENNKWDALDWEKFENPPGWEAPHVENPCMEIPLSLRWEQGVVEEAGAQFFQSVEDQVRREKRNPKKFNWIKEGF